MPVSLRKQWRITWN